MNYRQSLNWKLNSINGFVDDSTEQLSAGCIVLDEKQERMVGNELSRVAAELVNQLDFYEEIFSLTSTLQNFMIVDEILRTSGSTL